MYLYLVADDAFAFKDYMMKPYRRDLATGSPNTILNYRLSRARRIVENAFRLMALIFRVFRRPMMVKPDTVVDIVLTCIHLRNFLRRNTLSKLLLPT